MECCSLPPQYLHWLALGKIKVPNLCLTPVSPVAQMPAVGRTRGRTGGCAASGWAPSFGGVVASSLPCSPAATEDLSQSPRARPAAGGALKPELRAVAVTCAGGTRALWHQGVGGPRGEAARGRRKKQVPHTYVCKQGKGRENASSPSGEPPDELSWKHWGKVCLETMSLETTVLVLGTKSHGCNRFIFWLFAPFSVCPIPVANGISFHVVLPPLFLLVFLSTNCSQPSCTVAFYSSQLAGSCETSR